MINVIIDHDASGIGDEPSCGAFVVMEVSIPTCNDRSYLDGCVYLSAGYYSGASRRVPSLNTIVCTS